MRHLLCTGNEKLHHEVDTLAVPDALYNLMEKEYKFRGASCNGAQLNIRGDILRQRVQKYGADIVKLMLIYDFDGYHYDKPDIKLLKFLESKGVHNWRKNGQ